MRWTLSQPVVATVPPGAEDLFWMAVDIAEHFTPITESETRVRHEQANGVTPVFSR